MASGQLPVADNLADIEELGAISFFLQNLFVFLCALSALCG
jgi:hypothetical protein